MKKDKNEHYIRRQILPAIKNFFKRSDPTVYFIILMGLSLAIFIITCLILGYTHFTSIFFKHGKDLFMDFFNSVRDVFQGTGAYTQRRVIYPPMANLIFLIFQKLIPDEYSATSFNERYQWVNYPAAILSCMVFVCLCVLLFIIAFNCMLPKCNKKKALIMFFIVMNVPMLFMIARANILILAIAALAVYAFTYDSESKLSRELGLLALAFSFSLKLYPAVFGIFLLIDKRYKETVRCIIYALLFLLLPSLFFGGPICIVWMIENIFSFSSRTTGWAYFSEFLHIPELTLKIILFMVLILSVVCLIISSCIKKVRWKRLLFVCTILMCVPSIHALYAWEFLLIPLIMFCSSAKLKGINWLYFIFTLLPFLFFPNLISFKNGENIKTTNAIFMMACTLCLFIVCLVDSLFTIIHFRRDKKQSEVLAESDTKTV